MIHFIFETLYGWWGVAGITVVVCLVLGYFFPSLRVILLAVAGVAISFATAFTKGWTARGRMERTRQDEAVQQARKEYDQIDARPDTPADVADRLRRGGF